MWWCGVDARVEIVAHVGWIIGFSCIEIFIAKLWPDQLSSEGVLEDSIANLGREAE